jgi:hypothetical protein
LRGGQRAGKPAAADFRWRRPIIEAMQSRSQSLRVRENSLMSHVLADWVDQPPGYERPVR